MLVELFFDRCFCSVFCVNVVAVTVHSFVSDKMKDPEATTHYVWEKSNIYREVHIAQVCGIVSLSLEKVLRIN